MQKLCFSYIFVFVKERTGPAAPQHIISFILHSPLEFLPHVSKRLRWTCAQHCFCIHSGTIGRAAYFVFMGTDGRDTCPHGVRRPKRSKFAPRRVVRPAGYTFAHGPPGTCAGRPRPELGPNARNVFMNFADSLAHLYGRLTAGVCCLVN